MDQIIIEDIQNIIEPLKEEFQKLAGSRFLITGANGFLPSYLVDTLMLLNETELKENPVKVIVATRREPPDHYRLKPWIENPNLEFLKHDFTKEFTYYGSVDYIIHAASKASPKDYYKSPIDVLLTNTVGTQSLLDYASKQRLKGFLFISTGEVYGDPEPNALPVKEEYAGRVPLASPRAIHQESKRFGETLCYTYQRQFGVPVKIGRLFHTYGPRLTLDDGRVIAEFFRRSIAGEKLEITQAVGAVRTFAYISDSIEALWRVLLLGKVGAPYNVGSDQDISIKDLAQIFLEMFDGKVEATDIKISEYKHLTGTPSVTTPSLEKARAEIGYAPKVKLQDGLTRLKKWYELDASQ
jgi:UDP-glucuronate decarboxylase